MEKAVKITSYPRDVTWARTRNGKWVSRAITPADKKTRKEFCEKRNWECIQGCC